MDKSCTRNSAARDWAGSWRSLAVLWGLPAAAMVAALMFQSVPRAIVWAAALIWMGGACIANARRCGRTHCRFTGPFYVLMAALVIAYAFGLIPIGDRGWAILGAMVIVGTAVLWWGSERVWGMFWRRR